MLGWNGESYDPEAVFGRAEPPEQHSSRSIQISQQPLAFVRHNLLSAEEARHLVSLAAPRLKRSMVGGGSAVTQVCREGLEGVGEEG